MQEEDRFGENSLETAFQNIKQSIEYISLRPEALVLPETLTAAMINLFQEILKIEFTPEEEG